MKTTKKIIAAFLISFFLIGVSIVYASGTPALDLYVSGSSSTTTPTNLIIVTKYASGSYTYAEAEAFSKVVTNLLGLGSTQGISTTGFYHYTPSQVAAWGITDADTLKSMVKTYYKSWGFTLYAFLDIKRVTSVMPSLGSAMRIDIWVADMAVQLGLTGDYLYVVSLEIPEAYLTLLTTP